MPNQFANIAETNIAIYGEDMVATIRGKVAGEKGSRTRESDTTRVFKGLVADNTSTIGSNGKSAVELTLNISAKSGYVPQVLDQVAVRGVPYTITEVKEIGAFGSVALYEVKGAP